MSQPLGNRFRQAWNALRGREPQRAGGHARAMRSSYRGAEFNRLMADFVARCLSPQDELRNDMKIMRARARDLTRNDPIARHFVNHLLVANVIGARGPRLEAQVRTPNGELDEPVNEAIEQAWAQWSTGPVTTNRRLNFAQLQHLQIKSLGRDGEAFTQFVEGPDRRFGLALRPVDADLVDETFNVPATGRSPEVRLGVEVDEDGLARAYQVWDGSYAGSLYARNRVRVPADQILHQFVMDRADQTRGVTWLASVIVELQHMLHYSEAELVGARVGAAQMGFITQSDDSTAGPDQSEEPAELEANPGTLVRLAPGEDLKEWAPNHPSTAYGDFVKHLTRRISSGLGASYGALANDPSDASWSNARTSLQLERELWVMLQEDWVSQFNQPIFERWLNTAILSGELRLPTMDWRRYTAATWVTRKWDWVDPLKDLQASQLAIQMGLTSRTRVLAAQGLELTDVYDHLRQESELAKKYGIDVTGGGGSGAPAPAKPEREEREDEPTEDDEADPDGAEQRARPMRRELAAALNGKSH